MEELTTETAPRCQMTPSADLFWRYVPHATMHLCLLLECIKVLPPPPKEQTLYPIGP